MKLLFDLGHPAHVHLFRNLIKRVYSKGGKVVATTRQKDVTVELCRCYNIPQIVLSHANTGQFVTGTWELLSRTIKLIRVAKRFGANALLGTSMSIGIAGRLIGRPSFVFNEDNCDVVPLFANIAYPVCTYVVTPECLQNEDYGLRHLTYPGYHELAYLHPDHFTPDPAALHSIGLGPHQSYFILRFVTLKAHHDSDASGLPFKVVQELIDVLSSRGKVLITTEGPLHPGFKEYQFPLSPDKLHDVLAFASMYIGDSQTVAAEAAVLGVPSLRCNSFVGRLSYLNELEKTYGLTKGFLPNETDKLLATVRRWLANLEDVKQGMQLKRKKMLERCVNLADWQWQMLCGKLSL